jgi:hypothetical protein
MKGKRSVRIALVLGVALAAMPAFAAPPDSREEAARKVAESWLGLVDAGQYGESWDAAASFFRGKVPRATWEKMARSVRGDLGEFQSREFLAMQYTKELPGAPDGEYVVVQFRAVYANKKSAIETVTPMLDSDGQWRVSGYFVK